MIARAAAPDATDEASLYRELATFLRGDARARLRRAEAVERLVGLPGLERMRNAVAIELRGDAARSVALAELCDGALARVEAAEIARAGGGR